MRLLLLSLVMLAVLIGAHKADAACGAKIAGAQSVVTGNNSSR
jgi:hypothetical protein